MSPRRCKPPRHYTQWCCDVGDLQTAHYRIVQQTVRFSILITYSKLSAVFHIYIYTFALATPCERKTFAKSELSFALYCAEHIFSSHIIQKMFFFLSQNVFEKYNAIMKGGGRVVCGVGKLNNDEDVCHTIANSFFCCYGLDFICAFSLEC